MVSAATFLRLLAIALGGASVGEGVLLNSTPQLSEKPADGTAPILPPGHEPPAPAAAHDPKDVSLSALAPEERGPVDEYKRVTLASDMTAKERRAAKRSGWIDDGIPEPAAVYNVADAKRDPRLAAEVSGVHPTPGFDIRDRNPYEFKHSYRRQMELWRAYDRVSPNDTGKRRMEPWWAAPSDIGRISRFKRHYRNRPTDATVDEDADPVDKGASELRRYNPGNPVKNLNKLFPVDDARTIDDPIINQLNSGSHEASPGHPLHTRHYFGMPSTTKFLKTPVRARGRYMGSEDQWDKIIRGRRMDTAQTAVLDPTIARSRTGLSHEGGNGMDPDELGGMVDVQPRVQLVGNAPEKDEDLTWRAKPLLSQGLPRTAENPFKDNDPDGDFH